MTTRCKFECTSVRKYKSWGPGAAFYYEAELTVVVSGSEENKQFFTSTPTGNIKVSAIHDVFTPGKKYYVDFTETE